MANRRPDYSPLAAPPNPREEQARAAKREYMKQVLHQVEAPKVEAQQDHETEWQEESVALFERLLEKHGEPTDEAKIAAALTIWPAIARHHLRVGVGLAWDAERQCHVERDGVVVYDTSEDDAAPHAGGTSDAQDAQKG